MAYSKVRTRTTQQHAAENTGYTYSLSSSYSSSALDYEREHKLAPVFDSPRMSRRSLRLNASTSHYRDDSLLDSSQSRSISYSTGGSVHKESKTLKSRRSHNTTSGSGSLLQTPVKNQSNSVLQAHNSSLHSCAASDASLLSSLLDESCIQERTLIDSVWGLDEDGDLKDRNLRMDRSFTSVNNSNISMAQTQTFTVTSGYICKDCTAGHSDNRDALPAYSTSKPCSSSSCSYSSSTSALHIDARDGASSPYTTVYSREKSRRHRSGLLRLLFEACLHYSRKAAASVVFVFALLMQSILPKTDQQGKALLWSVTDWCASLCKKVASFSAAALTLLTRSAGLRGASSVSANGGHAGYCGTMNVNELVTQKEHQDLSGPLCKAASGAFWWIGTAWYQLVTLMSLLNVFFLTRCLPILRKILLILLPFLLLLALWYWGLSSFWAILPVANKMTRTTDSSLSFTSAQTPMDKASESQPGSGPSYTHYEQDITLAAAAYSERLTQIEQSLAQLWERVVASGSRQEQRHEEVLSLYSSLRDQLHTHTDRESVGQWVSTLMEQRVSLLRTQMEKEKQQSQQHQEEFEQESQTQKSRLAEVETLLKNLALKTEELQRRQDSETTSSVSGEVDDASHLTLLAEVRRLEEALESIRTDLQGMMGCKGRCEQLDSLHDTVSEQVRQELRSLLYGREQPEGAELPDSVLQWLSTWFVSSSDLQASLISLERSILRNVSLQLEQMQQKPCAETVTWAVRKTTDEAGLSEENVQLIVQNALKLYSQDRIGLVDYALESGGGSVLSTRCSETYETKTALMSLFGLPLWYFSQSPRAVIQPDVHPGNCWAFRGSHGYLVIRLSMKIIPTAFSLEHIPKTLSPTGNISSAPRNFTVYGLDDEQQEEGQVLGRYVYQEDGEPLQTYPVKENSTNTYQIIELRVLSNWGHPEYTCLYRFRVHGKPEH
ncbi:SUN domain-containing protein 1 isoform X7 [Colossoma macropomum]|uniref:SUN domain-containing protein 1 isoform X7 n=1 Tax=Colossoma macropomum TaxID=42526 RepID=UPI00186486BE|nr:SUN domain-containing protein 1 isoform X7 [Colossoma macropomum]